MAFMVGTWRFWSDWDLGESSESSFPFLWDELGQSMA